MLETANLGRTAGRRQSSLAATCLRQARSPIWAANYSFASGAAGSLMWLAKAAFGVLLLGVVIASAQPIAKDQVVELQSGGRVVLRADGTMGHYDARGNAISMQDGVVMIDKDGDRLIMKSRSLWREVLETAGSIYAQSTVEPNLWRQTERTIELEGGDRVVISRDGSMVHYDRDGKKLSMMDGEIMVAKDGSRILMANGAVWKDAAKASSAPR